MMCNRVLHVSSIFITIIIVLFAKISYLNSHKNSNDVSLNIYLDKDVLVINDTLKVLVKVTKNGIAIRGAIVGLMVVDSQGELVKFLTNKTNEYGLAFFKLVINEKWSIGGYKVWVGIHGYPNYNYTHFIVYNPTDSKYIIWIKDSLGRPLPYANVTLSGSIEGLYKVDQYGVLILNTNGVLHVRVIWLSLIHI